MKLLIFTWPADIRVIEERVLRTFGLQSQGCELWGHLPGQHCLRHARPFSDLYLLASQWQHQPGKIVHFHYYPRLPPETDLAFRVHGKACGAGTKRTLTFEKPIHDFSIIDGRYVDKFPDFATRGVEMLWWHTKDETCGDIRPLSMLFTLDTLPHGKTLRIHGVKEADLGEYQIDYIANCQTQAQVVAAQRMDGDEIRRGERLDELSNAFAELDERLRVHSDRQQQRRSQASHFGLTDFVDDG